MVYLGIFILLSALFLLIRLLSLKKEVKNITEQLQLYNQRKTNKKMDMVLGDQDMERLGLEINQLIDLYVSENRRRVRFEQEQRQAIANMSHDLRTPLTSILGYIQMAEAEDVTEKERKEWLSIANSRARRLETLLKDFFELSVIESTDYHLKSKKISLKNLTIDALMSFYDRFKERNMEPMIHLPDQDIFIHSDGSAVTRVIENLLANAITHSDGNIMVSLDDYASTARLTVTNDAHSLTEEAVSRMFDRFYMADQSRTGKSTGLGLSIVKGLMEKMNGTITGTLKDKKLTIVCEWKKG
ncbi:sensor histidine kinase [Bacillus tuaregi]|uniref:sensor histidine kinase n=1 Tax=Bacillus tuaregi TaxID=1816695 RepID=UPI0008F80F56|nr:HAMP domain-containing sensor histidine kinase [Bacillus tuaregi]